MRQENLSHENHKHSTKAKRSGKNKIKQNKKDSH